MKHAMLRTTDYVDIHGVYCYICTRFAHFDHTVRNLDEIQLDIFLW